MKPKRVLWLIHRLDAPYEAKKRLLENHAYQVTWVYKLSDLASEINRQRASVIMVSEDGLTSQVLDNILGLSSLAEARGSRWILTLKDHDPKVIKLASGCNFRDIIPMALADKQWLFRFLYSTAGKALPYPTPRGQIGFMHALHLNFPCRLIWLSPDRLRLECHLEPVVGARLSLRETFLVHLPAVMKHEATLVVERIDRQRLNYRYSNAIEGRWFVEDVTNLQRDEIVQQLQAHSPRARYRILLGLKQPSLRQRVFSELSEDEFKLNAALQLKSLALEPAFFSPDLVLIESFLLSDSYRDYLTGMLEALPENIPIVILQTHLGEQLSHPLFEARSITYVDSTSTADLANTLRPLLPNPEELNARRRKTAAYMDSSDTLGFGFLRVNAHGRSLHPVVADLQLSIGVRDFSLCQVESPVLEKWLPKGVWLKLGQVVVSRGTAELTPKIEVSGQWVDLTQFEQRLLADRLIRVTSRLFDVNLDDLVRTRLKTNSVGQAYVEHEALEAQSLEATEALHKDSSLPTISIPKREGRKVSQSQEEELATSLKPILIYALAAIILLAIIVQLVSWIAPYYHKSGDTFVEQLEKFSGRNGNGEPMPAENPPASGKEGS